MLVGKLFRELISMFTCHFARRTLRPEDLRAARRSELPYKILYYNNYIYIYYKEIWKFFEGFGYKSAEGAEN